MKKQDVDDEKVVDETKAIIGNGGLERKLISKEMDENKVRTILKLVRSTC